MFRHGLSHRLLVLAAALFVYGVGPNHFGGDRLDELNRDVGRVLDSRAVQYLVGGRTQLLVADQLPEPPLRQVVGKNTNDPDIAFWLAVPVKLMVMSARTTPSPQAKGP